MRVWWIYDIISYHNKTHYLGSFLDLSKAFNCEIIKCWWINLNFTGLRFHVHVHVQYTQIGELQSGTAPVPSAALRPNFVFNLHKWHWKYRHNIIDRLTTSFPFHCHLSPLLHFPLPSLPLPQPLPLLHPLHLPYSSFPYSLTFPTSPPPLSLSTRDFPLDLFHS